MVYPERSREEFEELVSKLSSPLRRMARSFNGYLKYIDEDDLVQEALSHLWIRFKKGELEDKTDSYLLRSCYFYLKNHFRKMREKTEVVSLSAPIDEEGTTLGEMIPSSPLPFAETIENKALIDGIRKNGLTKREREVFKFYLEGYTVREIGRILGISHVMVVKLKQRIIKKWQKKEKIKVVRLCSPPKLNPE